MIHDRMNGQNLNDCTVKNLSTGKLLRDETVCKGLFARFFHKKLIYTVYFIPYKQ